MLVITKETFEMERAVRNLKLKYKSQLQQMEKEEEPMAVKVVGGKLEGISPEKEVEKEKEVKKPELEEAGLQIKEFKRVSIADLKTVGKVRVEEEVEKTTLATRYPLTPFKPKEGEKVFAWSNIKWDEKTSSLVYYVMEPKLSPDDQKKIQRIKSTIEEKLDVRFEAFQQEAATDYLKKSIDDVITRLEILIMPGKREVYEYYIFRDFIGLNKLQPIMNDRNIEDVSCDGIGVPVFIYHRNPQIGSIKTNVVLETEDELNDFVMKLAQRCKKSISVAEPLLQGALPDGSRVQATLGTDIARKGSNFTIRKFTTEPLTPIHMLQFGTVNEKTLAYLWFIIEHNSSVLIAGPTASGKTSLLNALSLFIRPTLKIVSIEDTPELRLPHAHWVPEVARGGFGVTTAGMRIGEVSMFDLLKGSLRQRPDYIIVGEVRGEEASVLFQQIATGHAGLSTLHADSIEKIIDRMTTPPIDLPAALLETLSSVIFIKHMRYKNEHVRRVTDIHEIIGYDLKRKLLLTNKVFKWNASNDSFEVDRDSVLLAKLSETYGINEDQLKAELLRRIKVLTWMKENNMTYYKDVGRIFSMYYANPENVIDLIGE